MLRRNDETIATLLLIYLLPIEVSTVAASATSAWWTHLAYIFFHANLFHLAVNVYALWFAPTNWKKLTAAAVIAVVASFATPTPVVGFSTVVYALWGMGMLHASGKAWILFAVVNAATACLPGIGWVAHLSAFSLGMGHSYLNQLNNEYRRACKGR